MQKENLGRPYPEILPGERGGKWSVQCPFDANLNYSGQTDLGNKVIVTPNTPNDAGLFVRTHEMLHARFSPKNPTTIAKKNGVAEDMLKVAEDTRMAHIATGTSLLHRVPGLSGLMSEGVLEVITKEYPQRKPKFIEGNARLFMVDPQQWLRGTVMALAAGWRTSDLPTFNAWITEAVNTTPDGPLREAALAVLQELPRKVNAICSAEYGKRRVIPAFLRTISVAKKLEALCAFPSEGWGKKPHHTAPSSVKAAPNMEGTNMEVPWGTMTVEHPPLTEVLAVRHRLRRVRPTESGDGIGRIDRLLSDGKVFQDVRRWNGGTVLVDCSASMGLTADAVRRLVMTCPTVTVAIYAGVGGAKSGILRVVAERGKFHEGTKAYKIGPCNVIDGPALEWLGTQAAPRLWVCDGGVTGVGDRQTPSLLLHAALLQYRHKITRVPWLGTVTKTLKALQSRRQR